MTAIAPQEMAARVGTESVSDWVLVSQAMIDAFADATGDHQFIHVDPVRAARTPFGGTMTDAQRTFLTNELANWDSVSSDIIDKTARNGMVQARVDDVKVDLTARQNSLKGMIGDIVDANMPVASVELEKATLALQA